MTDTMGALITFGLQILMLIVIIKNCEHLNDYDTGYYDGFEEGFYAGLKEETEWQSQEK